MNYYKNLEIFLQNESHLQKIACEILSQRDLEGYLKDGYTKGQIIKKAYPQFKKWVNNTDTARLFLKKGFDLLLDFNKTL